MEKRQSAYGDKDGVQLRGDKGKARRKSTASQISKPNQINAPVSNDNILFVLMKSVPMIYTVTNFVLHCEQADYGFIQFSDSVVLAALSLHQDIITQIYKILPKLLLLLSMAFFRTDCFFQCITSL